MPARPYLVFAGTTWWLLATAAVAAGSSDSPPRDGLVLSWEVRDTAALANSGSLPDGSDQENHGSLLEGAAIQGDPARLELDGSGAVVAQRPIRVEQLTLEAVFRVDRTRGPLQLIVSTRAPKVRPATAVVPGNPRQWCLQIRGLPPQDDGYPGFLEFCIFGQDGRWHPVMSETRITKGWHHAIGTFDGKRVRLILDGKEQTRTRSGHPDLYEGTINQPPDTIVNLPAIGANSLKNPTGLDGAVALARLYDRPIGDDEIQESIRYARTLVPQLTTQVPRPQPAKVQFKVLYSNDFTNTGIVAPWHAKGEPFRPEHLRATVREAKGADVHLLQPAHCGVPWWPTKLYPLAEHHAWWAEHYGIQPDKLRFPGVHQYLLDGGDPFREFLDECRQDGQVPFISMRLNDTHHHIHAETPGNQQGIHAISRFYAEHPEWRLGPVGTGLDWSVPEVRQRMFALIEEICENYPINGLELDFMRFPHFFKDDLPAERRIDIVTRFVADVRAVLDRTAGSGQHRLLGIRVPCLLAMHPDIGVDLPSLVDTGVEMVNLSPTYFTFQAHDLAKIRRQVPDVALYLELCHTTMTGERLTTTGGDNFLFMRTTDQQYYTTAHVAYRRGADGVSLFNFVYTRDHGVPGRGPFNEPPFHILEHLGDPDWLARQPQWYFLAENWFTGSNGQLPARFEKGDARTFELDMAPTRHQQADGIFRLMAAEKITARSWMVKVNGTTLEPTGYVHKPLPHPYEAGLGAPSDYACFKCPRHLVRDGINRVALILEDGDPAVVRYWDLVLP